MSLLIPTKALIIPINVQETTGNIQQALNQANEKIVKSAKKKVEKTVDITVDTINNTLSPPLKDIARNTGLIPVKKDKEKEKEKDKDKSHIHSLHHHKRLSHGEKRESSESKDTKHKSTRDRSHSQG